MNLTTSSTPSPLLYSPFSYTSSISPPSISPLIYLTPHPSHPPSISPPIYLTPHPFPPHPFHHSFISPPIHLTTHPSHHSSISPHILLTTHPSHHSSISSLIHLTTHPSHHSFIPPTTHLPSNHFMPSITSSFILVYSTESTTRSTYRLFYTPSSHPIHTMHIHSTFNASVQRCF